MKDFFKENIKDILIVLAVLAFGLIIFVGHQGHMLIDCGREVYLPAEVLKGKVLYKDIFNVYGPLSYQINALLYFVLGEKLSTLYFAGCISAITIILSLFLITKEISCSRIAKAVTYFVVATCVCNAYIFNFVFPYSFAVSYALSSFLAALLSLVYYLKTSDKKFIFISAFLTGMSLTFKYEYTLFLAVLGFVIFYLKPLNKKELFYTFLSFISVPIVSYGVLFVQGLTFGDMFYSISIIRKMLAAPSLKFLYQNSAGFYPNPQFIVMNIVTFVKNSVIFLFVAALAYFVSSLWLKEEKNAGKKALNILPLIFLAFIFPYKLFYSLVSYDAYSWLPFTTFAIMILSGYKIFKAKGFKNVDDKQTLFFILSICGVLSAIKTFWSLSLISYGPFALPLLLMINVVFITEELPKKFEILDKEHLSKVIAFILIVLSILLFQLNMKAYQKAPVSTPKGTIYTSHSMAQVYNQLIDYTNKNIPKQSKILVMPEGPMINFLTNHPSDDVYNSLIPLYVETFGEDKIISDLKKNPPDYIFINNRDSRDYGHSYICLDYAFKVCDYVSKNYTVKKVINEKTKFIILKKNS